VVVNNAGILRDRMLANMTEAEWDDVVRVHLKGTAAPAFHAVSHWRANKKAGNKNDARIINTTSHSGLFGSLVGQTNYASAKAGIASFTLVLANEMAGAGYGVTVNAIAPRANTRLTAGMSYSEEVLRRRSPTWIASLATYLSSPQAADITGRIFEAWGIRYSVLEGYTHGPEMEAQEDPTLIGAEVHRIVARGPPEPDPRPRVGFPPPDTAPGHDEPTDPAGLALRAGRTDLRLSRHHPVCPRLGSVRRSAGQGRPALHL
jgi:hypothetical protein